MLFRFFLNYAIKKKKDSLIDIALKWSSKLSIMNDNYRKIKVIKGQIIPAVELKRKHEKSSVTNNKLDKLKSFFKKCASAFCPPCDDDDNDDDDYIDEVKNKKISNEIFEMDEIKNERNLKSSGNNLNLKKNLVYCKDIEPKKMNAYNNKSVFETDIVSNKQDAISTIFEIDINNMYTNISMHQSHDLYAKKETDTIKLKSGRSNESFKPKVTFSDLFGNLDNFKMDDSFDSSSESSTNGDYDDWKSFENSEGYIQAQKMAFENFRFDAIVYEWVTYF